MAEIKLPPQAQQILLQIQAFQQQMQNIGLQKESFTIQNMDLDKALEELKKVGENDDVYKAVGPILIKSTKKELELELKERKEAIELRLKSIGKQEDKLKEKMKEAQNKIEDILKSSRKEEDIAG